MRASTIMSVLFATAAFAAPILDISSGHPMDTTTVTDFVDEVGMAFGSESVHELPTQSLGGRSEYPETLVDTTTDTSVSNTSSSLLGNLLGNLLGGVLDTVNELLVTVTGLLTDVTNLVDNITSILNSLLYNLENADVENVLYTVETLLKQLLTKIQRIPCNNGSDSGLSGLDTTLASIVSAVTALVQLVQSLVDAGVTGDSMDTVQNLLAQVLFAISVVSL